MNYLKNFVDQGELVNNGYCLGYLPLNTEQMFYHMTSAETHQQRYCCGMQKVLQDYLSSYCCYYSPSTNSIEFLDSENIIKGKGQYIKDLDALFIKIRLAGCEIKVYNSKEVINKEIEDLIKEYQVDISYNIYINQHKTHFKILLQNLIIYVEKSYPHFLIAVGNGKMYLYRYNNLIGSSDYKDFEQCFKLYMARNILPIIKEGFKPVKGFKYICF